MLFIAWLAQWVRASWQYWRLKKVATEGAPNQMESIAAIIIRDARSVSWLARTMDSIIPQDILMKNLAITFTVLLLGAAAAWPDESPKIKPVRSTDAFQATLRKIDGDKITLVRHAPEGDEKEETLIAAADCTLLEPRWNKQTGSVEWRDSAPRGGAVASHQRNRLTRLGRLRANRCRSGRHAVRGNTKIAGRSLEGGVTAGSAEFWRAYRLQSL
jgi:hypothetical protein